MADITKDQVIEWLSGLSVLDIAALVKELEDKWGVSAAAPVAVVAGGAAAAPVEEKDTFDVILKAVDASKKIAVIRKSAQSLPSALRTRKPSLKALPRLSRKALPRKKLKLSRLSCPKSALPSPLNKYCLMTAAEGNFCRFFVVSGGQRLTGVP